MSWACVWLNLSNSNQTLGKVFKTIIQRDYRTDSDRHKNIQTDTCTQTRPWQQRNRMSRRLKHCKDASNFIDKTMIWYLNSKLDLNLSWAKDFLILNSMVTWCINWRKLSYSLTIFGTNIFSAQFIKIISYYKKIGYNINVLQQTAYLVVNPIMVGNVAFLFYYSLVGWTSDSMTVQT